MKLLNGFVLCFFLCVSYTLAETPEPDNKHKTTHPPTSTTSTKPSTTTEPSTTSQSTTPPPSTPSSTIPTPTSPSTTPATPTPAPTTPSPAPTTPTPAPTTPTPTPPTPTPTSPAPSSTTPPPSPSSTTPPPPPKDWVVINPNTKKPCIMAAMDVTFNLKSGNITQEIKINPATAKAENGSCGPVNSTSQYLRLVWALGNQSSTFLITFTEKDKNFFISGLNLTLSYNTSKEIKIADFSAANLTLFGTSLNTSYYCDSAEFPELKNAAKELVDIRVSALQVEAFKSGNSTTFSSSHYCPGEVPDIVPLVVGICLAGLVLVVVIAYLIGRRRSQASGYLSM